MRCIINYCAHREARSASQIRSAISSCVVEPSRVFVSSSWCSLLCASPKRLRFFVVRLQMLDVRTYSAEATTECRNLHIYISDPPPPQRSPRVNGAFMSGVYWVRLFPSRGGSCSFYAFRVKERHILYGFWETTPPRIGQLPLSPLPCPTFFSQSVPLEAAVIPQRLPPPNRGELRFRPPHHS